METIMIARYAQSILAGILALCTTTLLPVCPEMEVWSNGTNYRYLIKDWHTDYIDGRISIKQQQDIIRVAQQKKDDGVFVIAEDLWAYPGDNQKIQRKYIYKTIEESIAYIQKRENIDPQTTKNSSLIFKTQASPLNLLTNACALHGISYYNAECRHGLDRYLSIIPTSEKVHKEDVLNDLLQSISEIGESGELKEDHAQFTEQFNELQSLTSVEKEQEFIEKINTIRASLLEAKTIHKLIVWKTIKHGLIFEGKNHIEKIKKGLQDLGYQKIKHFGNPHVWQKPDHKNILENALDLHSTFQQIFNDSKKKSPIPYLMRYKWPIAIIAATIGIVGIWLYWQKDNSQPKYA